MTRHDVQFRVIIAISIFYSIILSLVYVLLFYFRHIVLYFHPYALYV